MNIKTEGLGFVKTLGVVIPLMGAVWGFTEPMIENYIPEQIHIIQEEDKALIKELEEIIENDYKRNTKRLNEIINEIHYIYPNSRLKTE